jgi:hypothetical protein
MLAVLAVLAMTPMGNEVRSGDTDDDRRVRRLPSDVKCVFLPRHEECGAKGVWAGREAVLGLMRW